MARRAKLTGFSRFLIFLLIAAPVIYCGVNIVQGENPVDALKRDFGIDLQRDKSADDSSSDTRSFEEDNSNASAENTKLIKYLRSKNEQLELENAELKAQLEALERQIE